MTDWDHEARDLFRAARHELSPRSGERERVRARLAMQIGAGAAVTTAAISAAASTSKAPATAATTVPLIAKIVAPLVVLGVIGGAAISARLLLKPSAPVVVATPAPAEAKPPVPAETTTAVEPPEPRGISVADLPSANTPVSPRASATKPNDELSEAARDEEAKLVAELDAALRAGDRARATALADDHERRFPHGLLSEEREGARVLVRCAGTPDASAARAFLHHHPRSPMRARIVAACAVSDDER